MKLSGKNMVRAIKLVVSCAFFFILFSFIRGNELLAIFRRIDWLYFSLSFSLIPVMLAASCLKWKVVLGERAGHVSFLQLLRIYAVGYFFSNLLPSTVGGDVVRSYYAGRLLGSQSYAAVSIFVERFTGILLLFFLVAAAPLLAPELYAIPYVWIPSCAGVVLLCISCYLCFSGNPLALPRKMLDLILGGLHAVASRSGSENAKKAVRSVEEGSVVLLRKLQKVREELELAIATFRRDRMYLLQVAGLTIIFYFLTWVNVYVSFRAFGVNPDFLAICALVPAILFAAHLPVTLLGNLGYFESVFVFYFLLIGIPGAETLAMGILLRLKMLTMGVIGYIVYLFYSEDRKLDLENLKKMAGR
ncbi:MAG: flippase-like domain-containing protein [Desulfobulbaceae bacterium]|nr:MAG: flippase-like domain-containing protein [Desulfobulbaceae bacterium]